LLPATKERLLEELKRKELKISSCLCLLVNGEVLAKGKIKSNFDWHAQKE
jgi:hypothetical protein